jgi:hypothetical protein
MPAATAAADPEDEPAVITWVERWSRIVGRKCGGRGLADDGCARLLQHRHDRRIGAGPKAPVDGRTHLGRQISRVNNILDADGDAAERSDSPRRRIFRQACKCPDRLLLRRDRDH